jgi:hypothetical protein
MKRFVKRALVFAGALVLVAAVAAGIAVYLTGRSGSGAIEKWIASQLQTIANSYVHPQLSFDDLDYEYPGTVKLKNFRLVADDPRNPGKTIAILGTADATVVLAEVPAVGRPIVIQKIILNQPLFQAIATGPGETTFVGFSGMVKQEAVDTAKAAAAGPASEEAKAARKKLSDVFQMRLVELINGKIVYDPRLEGAEPMVLDEINTRLDVIPDAAGEYTLKVALNRKPVFDFDIGMTLNIDTMYARDARINLSASLSSDSRSHLPPQIQKVLAHHDVRGELFVRVRGELPLTEYQKGDVLATVELTDANIKVGENRLPIERLDLQTKLAGGKVLLPVLKLQALAGQLTAGGEVTLNESLDSILALQVLNMQLEELFVNPDDAADPKLAGRLNVGVNTVVPLAALIPHLSKPAPATQPVIASASPPPLPQQWGEGILKLDKGRLVKIPVLGDLARLLAGGKKSIGKTESAEAKFTFGGDKLRLSEFRYLGDLVAARGTGTVSLDQQLDLVVNAGPVEKVQSLLGKDLGGAFGKLTDQLVSYLVTGPLDTPQIRPQVGGVVTRVGEGAVDKVGEGAKGVGKGAEDLLKGVFKKE